MTGVNINKIRHYAPGFNSRTTRLDADAAALIFKAGNSVISKSERLIANVSVKAAMPTAGDSDGKKRGLESANSSNFKNYMGIVFDPKAKKTEGSYFKHYVTETERIEALRSSEPKPNWGWINPNEPGNRLPKPTTAVAKVTRYPVNPKTGQPMKNFGFEPEIKGLGKTIGERNPGAKLAARAAKAAGLVIDALGKFRCPPGTPAANRFTNERGEGCFGISVDQVQDIASTLTNILSAPNDRITLVSGLMALGVTASQIRKEYKENGIAGLRSLASRRGGRPIFVGDAALDASYMSAIPAKIRERMEATKGAAARMERIRNRNKQVIEDLKAKYGITEEDEYLALGQIIKEMGKDKDAPFTPDQFSRLFMGGDPESHERWVTETAIDMHAEAIARKTGILDTAEMLAEYDRAKSAGEVTPLTQFIDAAIQREKSYRTGALRQIIVNAHDDPSSMLDPRGRPLQISILYSEFDGLGAFGNLNGAALPEKFYLGSGPAIKGFKVSPPPGYYDLYEATGGDIDDQWRAITEAMDGDEKSRRWIETYGTDLAAEVGNGWEDFGAQVATHEMTHIRQYHAIIDYFRATRPDENFDEMTNEQLWGFVSEFLNTASSAQVKEVFGIDLDEIIEKRIDALAGKYSQVEQQEALKALKMGNPRAFNRAKMIAFLETHAELSANRSVGLIGDDPEIDEFLESFVFNKDAPDGITPPPPSGIIVPGAEPAHWGEIIVPGAPPVPSDAELIIPGKRPITPPDAPRPAKPSKPGKTYTPLPSEPPPLPPGAGRDVTPRRPSSPGRIPGGRREPREPVGPFDRVRNGKVPTMIREGRFTNQDIEEHMYGEDGKGGLFAMFRSARNMRISDKNRARDKKRKELLNELIDTMGVSFEQLEAMADKIQNGEKLSPQEKQQLIAAISHLRNGANEFKRKAEEARERFRNFRGVDTSQDYNDQDANYVKLEQIQSEIEMYDSLFNRVGRGFAPAVHDILTMDENGPYPDRLGGIKPTRPNRDTDFAPGFDFDTAEKIFITPPERYVLASKGKTQNLVLSDTEIQSLERVAVSPPKSYLSGEKDSRRNLEIDIEDSLELSAAFERQGFISGIDVSVDVDFDTTLPSMRALDKLTLQDDVVVEIEIDIDTSVDAGIGSMYEIPSIHTADIVTEDEDMPGLASSSGRGRVGAGVVGRFIGSKRGRQLIEKAGVDPEQADLVQMISEVAIGFSVGGPAGAIVPLARRGGRDIGEKSLQIMVERGWIEKSLADKIIKHGLDRIASEGLPDEIIKAAEATKDRLLTEETKRKALDMGAVFQDRSLEIAEVAKEKASEMIDSAKEQASELIGRVGDRWRRRDDNTDIDPFSVDPFGNPIPTSPSELMTESSERGLASRAVEYSPRTPKEVERANRIVDAYLNSDKPIDEIAKEENVSTGVVSATITDARKYGEVHPTKRKRGKNYGQERETRQARTRPEGFRDAFTPEEIDARNRRILDAYINGDDIISIGEQENIAPLIVRTELDAARKRGELDPTKRKPGKNYKEEETTRGLASRAVEYSPRTQPQIERDNRILDAYLNTDKSISQIAEEENIGVAAVAVSLGDARKYGELHPTKRKRGENYGKERETKRNVEKTNTSAPSTPEETKIRDAGILNIYLNSDLTLAEIAEQQNISMNVLTSILLKARNSGKIHPKKRKPGKNYE